MDASFLRLESPTTSMHVGWSALLVPHPTRPRPTIGELRDSIASRLALVPVLRRRLAYAPLGLAEPSWVDDPDFSVANHVVELAGAGDIVPQAWFQRLADDFLSEPLDRRRPLWQVGLVPQLDDDRIGLVGKVHHAMVDGLAAVRLAMLLFDRTPDAERTAPELWIPAAGPGAARLAAEIVSDTALLPLRTAVGATRLAAYPRRTTRDAVKHVRQSAAALPSLLRPAPASMLNIPVGPRRSLIGHRAALADVRRARHDGATANDVCLAVVAGALRDVALRNGEQPVPLKTMVPVSMRRRGAHTELGNQITLAFVDLPLDARTAQARLARVQRQTRHFQSAGTPAGVATLLGAMSLLPPPLRTGFARAASSPRSQNLVVSNIPLPRIPLYMLGARIEELYPVVPLGPVHALSVGITTYGEHVFFGLHADPDALPWITSLPAALERHMRHLAGAARRPSGRADRTPRSGGVHDAPLSPRARIRP
jgi:diacylglycerol O-acyltransferase / wax synthase